MEPRPEVTVEVGEGVVVVRRRGVTRPAVANILDMRISENGTTRIVLDRLLHKPHERSLSSWSASGAYVTVLEQAIPILCSGASSA